MDSTQQVNDLFSPQEIEDIIQKDILDLMGMDNLTEEKRTELYDKMINTVEERVFMRIDATLDEAGQAELKQVLESGGKEEFDALLAKNNISVEKLFAEEALIYKTQLMSLLKTAQQQPKE